MFDNSFVLFYNQDVKDVLHLAEYKGGLVMENRIKEYREKNGFSQGKLGELCKVTRQTINAIENNKYDPSLELAFNLSYVLGLPIEELFVFKYERNGEK
jgi:putative transcriptional regulator